MKFDGKKHIDTGMYENIKITDRNGEVEVKAEPDKQFKNFYPDKISRPSLTDKIKDLPDEEKVKEIVEYFLRNNTIYKIKQENNVITVYGISERKLRLSLSHKYLDLIKLIVSKYTIDRVKQISEINTRKVKFNLDSTTTSYCIVEEKNKSGEYENVLHINLLKQPNEEVIKFDSEFIDNYINEFINSCEEPIRFINDLLHLIHGFAGDNNVIYLPNHEFYKKYVVDAATHNGKLVEDYENQQVFDFAKDSMPKKHVFDFYKEK